MSTAVSKFGNPLFKVKNPPQTAALRHLPRRKAPIQAPPVDWLLLDRRVAVLDPQFPDVLPLPPFASAATEDGYELRLYLDYPPCLSLGLLLDGEGPIRPGWRKPRVLAAHLDRLLLRLPVPPEVNLLIFTAGIESSLVNLPPKEELANLSGSRGSGFVSDGDRYVAAFFQSWITWSGNVQHERARVCMFSSRLGTWETIQFDDMPCSPPDGVQLNVWRVDASVPFNDCITWIDFSRGMITCDVLEQSPTLHFFNLPILSARTQVSWMLNGVCIAGDHLCFLSTSRGPGQHNATITVWSLDRQGYCWRQQGGLSLTCGASLPNCPVLDGLDSSIMYFMLQQGDLNFVYCVNWREPLFLSKYHYVDDPSRGAAFDTPYVGSDVSRYVENPPVMPVGPGDDNDGGIELQHLPPIAGLSRKARKTD